ncbi:MAG TPA: PhoH family protein [Gammaproteobacteria bacterium]|nr:PhoH family protein [Gammaproteobacteria bacterium]HIL95875.1 PhoH family protein [Pseudomonadales bacterium]
MAKRSHVNCSANRRKSIEGRKNKKHQHQQERQSRRHSADIYTLPVNSPQTETAYAPQRSYQALEAKTPSQQRYISAIKNNCLTFGIGPAGTGKSYCASAIAAEALQTGRIERLILTRPAVEAGEHLGFLPGALDEKFAVYIEAFRDALNERLGAGAVDYLLRHGRIVAAPLAFMRGKTFGNDSFVILDEAQNTTISQMKMFLTRIGEHCKVVVNGDIDQSDIRGPNGLADAVRRVRGLPNVHIHSFNRSDIVRSGLVRDLMDRYEVGG